jgi:PAS domain S-box-containing protein
MNQIKFPEALQEVFMKAYRQYPLRVACLYALFGGLWIIGSDRLAAWLFPDPQLLLQANTYKGWFFIAVTASLLYLELSREYSRLERITAAQQASEQRYQTLARISPVGIFQTDAKASTTYVNPKWCAISGLAADQALGEGWLEAVHPEDREKLNRGWQTSAQLRQAAYSDYRFLRPDGTLAWVMGQVLPEINAENEIIGYVGTITDITERKQAEAKLIESHELLANLARLVPGVIYQYRLDPDGRSAFPYSSPGMNDIYEVTPAEVQADATPVFERLHPEDYERVANLIQESARTLQEFYCEFRVMLPRQGLRWRWSQAHPERMADGGTLWHGIISDITEAKQAQEKIQQLNAELEERVEARTRELREAQEQLIQQERLAVLGRLAGGVGEELRNPLGVISNAVYFLKMILPNADENVKDYLEILEHENQAATQLVSDLLNFSNIQPGDRQPVPVAELARQTLEKRPVPAGVTVSLDFPPGIPPAFVDPFQMEQALGNLVVNACQAMPEGGNLTISAHLQAGMMMVALKDTGMGILPENLPKLFKPLFSTKPRGIGLGLVIAQKLIEANGGRIEVESEPGKGSTFTVWLPVKNGISLRAAGGGEAISD